jgi:hypothetical protein
VRGELRAPRGRVGRVARRGVAHAQLACLWRWQALSH